jgi:hypothetical protein
MLLGEHPSTDSEAEDTIARNTASSPSISVWRRAVSHIPSDMSCPRRANDGMAQLKAPTLQKGELLEVLSVLPLRRLLCPMLLHKLALKENNFLHNALGVNTRRGERCGILRFCFGHPLWCLPFR